MKKSSHRLILFYSLIIITHSFSENRQCTTRDIVDEVCDGNWIARLNVPCRAYKEDGRCGYVPEHWGWGGPGPILGDGTDTLSSSGRVFLGGKVVHDCDTDVNPKGYDRCQEGGECVCPINHRCTKEPTDKQVKAEADKWIWKARDSLQAESRKRGLTQAITVSIQNPSISVEQPDLCVKHWKASFIANPSQVFVPKKPKKCIVDEPENNLDCKSNPIGFTDEGISREKFLQSTPHVYNAAEKNEPYCTTCDHLSISDLNSLAACLREEREGLVKTRKLKMPPFKKSLEAKTQVFFEMYEPMLRDKIVPEKDGKKVSDEILEIYLSKGVLAACGSRLGLESCGRNNMLEFCNRLAGEHVPLETEKHYFERCISLASVEAKDSAGCPATSFNNARRNVATILLDRIIQAPMGSDTSRHIAEIRQRFEYLQFFYDKFASPRGPGFSNDGRRWVNGQVSRALGIIYESAYRAGEWNASMTENDLSTKGLEVDKRILLSALGKDSTQKAALSGLPLLIVAGDGFRGLATRARSVTSIHDFGCDLLECKGTLSAEVEAIWLIWASLTSPNQLDSAISRARKLPGDRKAKPVLTEWQSVFEALSRQSGILSQSVKDAWADSSNKEAIAMPYGTDLSDGNVEVVPLAREFSALIQEASARWSCFKKTGFLDWTPSAGQSAEFAMAESSLVAAYPRLAAGLDRRSVDAKQKELAKSIPAFLDLVDKYGETSKALLNTWLADKNMEAEVKSLNDRLKLKNKLFAYSIANLDGLKRMYGGYSAQFAEFTKQFEATMKADPLNPQFKVAGSFKTSISAADARYDGSASGLPEYAVSKGDQFQKITAKRGDVLRFEIDGRWSPTCAVEQMTIEGPGGRQQITIDKNALTTSEGFSVQWSNGNAKTENRSERDNSTLGIGGSLSADACVGAELRWGPKTPFGELQGFFTAKACAEVHAGFEAQNTVEIGKSKNTDTRWSISGASGLRANGTPFPNEPAGSLVLAHASPTLGIVSQVLLQPQSAFVVQEDGDYYLVVNDRVGCPEPNTAALNVHAYQLKSINMEGGRLEAAMISALDTIAAAKGPLKAQGMLLNTDLGVLKSKANEALRRNFGNIPLDDIPGSLRSFFNFLVDNAINSVELEVQMQSLSRDIAIQEMEIASIAGSIESEGGKSRVARSITRALLNDIDGMHLEKTTARMLALVRQEVTPVLNLRYPNVRNKLLQNHSDFVRSLQLVNLKSDGGALAHNVLKVVEALNIEWEHEITNSVTTPDSRTVFVGIPRKPEYPKEPYSNTMDEIRARSFWSKIDSGAAWVTLEIRPEDVYYQDGPNYYLPCHESNPVIEDIALVFLTNSPSTAFNGAIAHASFDGLMTFISDLGPVNYVMERKEFREVNLPVGIAERIDHQVISQFRGEHTGAGLSPFARFHLRLDQLRGKPESKQVFSSSKDAVIAMKLSYIRRASPVLLSACIDRKEHNPFIKKVISSFREMFRFQSK